MQLSKPLFEKWQAWPILSLLGFIIFLPLLEMPKSVFLLLFYLLASVAIWKNRAQYQWQSDDTLIVIWMFSGYVVAMFAGLHHQEWWGATATLKLALFLLVLKNIPLGEKLRQFLAMVVLFSTLVATSDGLWQLFITHQLSALELHSVGHVNHSSIYLGLNFALALAMTLVIKKTDTMSFKVFVIFCLVITAACIVISNSRATILTMAVIAMTFGLIWLKRSKLPLIILTLSIGVAAAGLYFEDAKVVQKHVQQTSHGPFLGEREAIWNSSLLAWRHFPWFGLGIKNFSQATTEFQTEWLAEEGKVFEEDQYRAYAHVHNLYLSTLAEQGLFGFCITMLVIGRIGFLLYKNRPRLADSDSYWYSWLAAFGAIQVVLVNGLLNTTLHSEHGLLTLLLIGLWWTSLDQRVQV